MTFLYGWLLKENCWSVVLSDCLATLWPVVCGNKEIKVSGRNDPLRLAELHDMVHITCFDAFGNLILEGLNKFVLISNFQEKRFLREKLILLPWLLGVVEIVLSP